MDIPAEQELDAVPAAADSAEDAGWCRQIAARIGAGDAAAEALLLERLRPGLQMILYARCSQNPDLSADLTQDALLITLKRLRTRSLEDPSRIAAFAAQTARQLAFDARRRIAVRRTGNDSAAVDAAPDEASHEEAVEKASIVSLVRKLVGELPTPRDREVLRRFYLLEQEKREICDFLRLAPGTFDQVVFRARARMRSLLDARGLASRDLLCAFLFWIPKSWRS